MSTLQFTGPIEIAPHFRPRPGLSHAIMDWDGTISLLRGGWVDLMVDLCLEHLPVLANDSPAVLRAQVQAEMLALNGKPSIHQMARIGELVVGRGGDALTPDGYQSHYVERITSVVGDRVANVRTGTHAAETLIVPGARQLLRTLANRGIKLSVASGTPHPELIGEAALLDLTPFFIDRFHGPRDTRDRAFTKRAAIHGIVADHRISGEHLLAVGDGPVEISETKALGGLAVAIASDESDPGARRFDDFKRRQLLDAGADIVVPDFIDAIPLVNLLVGTVAGIRE